jgi:hypothetical protein
LRKQRGFFLFTINDWPPDVDTDLHQNQILEQRSHLKFLERTRDLVLVALGLLFAGYHLRNSFFYQDQWDGISRALHMRPMQAMTTSINGHFMILDYWIHRLQVSAFGLQNHSFSIACMLVSLLTLNLVLIYGFRTLGLSGVTSSLTATVLTYMGAGAQNFLYVAQIFPILSIAVGLLAVFYVVGHEPSQYAGFVFGVGIFISVLLDSGMATIVFPAALVVVYCRWSLRLIWAIGPSLLFLCIWYLTADLSPHFASTKYEQLAFGFHIFLESIGSIIGSGQVAGLFPVFMFGVIARIGLQQKMYSQVEKIVCLAFLGSTALTVIAISISRAGVPEFTLFEANRYAHNIAIPFVIAFIPVGTVFLRSLALQFPNIRNLYLVRFLPIFLFGFVVISTQPTFVQYESSFTANNIKVHQLVQESVQVISQGCPTGTTLDTTSRPIGQLSPQVTTQLLFDLMTRDSLRADDTIAPSQETLDIMCLPRGE